MKVIYCNILETKQLGADKSSKKLSPPVCNTTIHKTQPELTNPPETNWKSSRRL